MAGAKRVHVIGPDGGSSRAPMSVVASRAPLIAGTACESRAPVTRRKSATDSGVRIRQRGERPRLWRVGMGNGEGSAMRRPAWKRVNPFVRQRQRSLRLPDLANLVVIPAEPGCPCAACGRAVA